MSIRNFLAFTLLTFSLNLPNKIVAEETTPYLSIVGPINLSDGLGRHAPELAEALSDEITVEILPTSIINGDNLTPSIQKVISNSKTPSGKVLLFYDTLWGTTIPQYEELYKHTVLEKNQNQIRIAYSMFESTKLPDSWISVLNTHFDAVAVPDDFLVESYKESGVKIPVFKLPLALDLSEFLNQPLKKGSNKPFKFGCFSSAVERKNIITVIRSFVKAFGNRNPEVKLLINCRYSDAQTYFFLKEEIASTKATNIKMKQSWLSKQDYIEQFKNVDVYVNLSKGEGFSIQPREAMCLGIPVIITDNTAQRTICESGLARAVPAFIQEPALYFWPFESCGKNFGCTVDDASKAMLDVYHNYQSYLRKGASARAWAKKYDFRKLKQLYKNFIKPKKIVLGSENKVTESTITTTSKALYEKWSKINKEMVKK